jgi:hypothetical protein
MFSVDPSCLAQDFTSASSKLPVAHFPSFPTYPFSLLYSAVCIVLVAAVLFSILVLV